MGKKYYLLPLLLDYYSISIIDNNYGKLPKYPGETARIATKQLTPSPKTNPPCSIEKKNKYYHQTANQFIGLVSNNKISQ